MSIDRRWAAKYQELLTGYIEALGGASITAPRRALAEQIAVLQCELSMLTDRFASGGRGGSTEDLGLYLKLSATAAELLQTAGLGPSLQQPPVDQSGSDARAKLSAMINNHIRARETEHSQGIFRGDDGKVITDPKRLALEQQIYDLQKQRDAMSDNPNTQEAAANPEPLAITRTAPPLPPDLKVASPAPAPKPKPAAPSPDIPGMYAAAALEAVDDKLSTTEKFLRWNGNTRPP
jgi:hypothetical protein